MRRLDSCLLQKLMGDETHAPAWMLITTMALAPS
jgi:hypothetical protein